jgi:hypothetical protein
MQEDTAMGKAMSTGAMLDQALRNRSSIWTTLKAAEAWPVSKAAAVNIGLAAFYGLVMGSYGLSSAGGWKQALASAVKVPCLFLLTLVICLPALYVVSALLGSSLNLRQLLSILMASFLVTTVLLAAFAPITAFFMLSTHHYIFIKLLNVVFFAIAAGAGVAVIASAVKTIGDQGASGYRVLLRFWFVIYAFVGTQMAWILRPFVGDPDAGFAIFRNLGGNFYADVLRSIGRLF